MVAAVVGVSICSELVLVSFSRGSMYYRSSNSRRAVV